jgi:hypothetical protein
MKRCRSCKALKPKALFYAKQSLCKECDRQRATSAYHVHEQPTEIERERRKETKSAWEKKRRRDPTKRSYIIWRDSRASDRRNGRANDLTIPFIESLVCQGCAYCGETTLKMTLDRVDNKVGHLQCNVVPACVRCNYLRRDMPYRAWLEIAKVIRRLRKQGLFGDWVGGVHSQSISIPYG